MIKTVLPGISAAVQHHLSTHNTAGSCLHTSAVLNMDTRLSREDITHLYNQRVCSRKAPSGTPYVCTQADIDAFHGFVRTVRSPTFLPAEEWFQTLTSFLTQQHPTPDILLCACATATRSMGSKLWLKLWLKRYYQGTTQYRQSLLQLSLTWQCQSTLVQQQQ